jgi:hypothetical protein
LLIPRLSQFFYFFSLTTIHLVKNRCDGMLVLAKIFLGLRLEWNFFIHEGTILLFYNIPGSIGPLDLSRFGAVL